MQGGGDSLNQYSGKKEGAGDQENKFVISIGPKCSLDPSISGGQVSKSPNQMSKVHAI